MIWKMQILLYNNESPRIKIHKEITLLATMAGTLRDETNTVNPTVRVAATEMPVFNYARIPDFGRYYYLRDVRAVRSGIWEIMLESDPLMSFDLSDISGVVVETENGGSNYLESRHFVRSVKSKTDILNFSGGLLETGEYILITAGGGA
jgi:hypothetical protein